MGKGVLVTTSFGVVHSLRGSPKVRVSRTKSVRPRHGSLDVIVQGSAATTTTKPLVRNSWGHNLKRDVDRVSTLRSSSVPH